jgi:hypothetical protein
MMSANAPPKISAMTSSVMSRICHQRIFFFFFPFPPLPLPPFLPDFLPFALRGASSSSRGGLRLPPLPPSTFYIPFVILLAWYIWPGHTNPQPFTYLRL